MVAAQAQCALVIHLDFLISGSVGSKCCNSIQPLYSSGKLSVPVQKDTSFSFMAAKNLQGNHERERTSSEDSSVRGCSTQKRLDYLLVCSILRPLISLRASPEVQGYSTTKWWRQRHMWEIRRAGIGGTTSLLPASLSLFLYDFFECSTSKVHIRWAQSATTRDAAA